MTKPSDFKKTILCLNCYKGGFFKNGDGKTPKCFWGSFIEHQEMYEKLVTVDKNTNSSNLKIVLKVWLYLLQSEPQGEQKGQNGTFCFNCEGKLQKDLPVRVIIPDTVIAELPSTNGPIRLKMFPTQKDKSLRQLSEQRNFWHGRESGQFPILAREDNLEQKSTEMTDFLDLTTFYIYYHFLKHLRNLYRF